MINRTQPVLILVCVIGALAFVGFQVFRATGTRKYAPGEAFTERVRLTEFAANGVRVEVFMDSDTQEHPLLRATFTPTESAFHLYSKDLDPKTTGGLGIATRLELLPNSSVRGAGQLLADRASQSHRVKDLDAVVDIYPDGPVSLRLPIEFVGVATNIPAQVAVSYMACKTDGICLLPVVRQVLDIKIVPK